MKYINIRDEGDIFNASGEKRRSFKESRIRNQSDTVFSGQRGCRNITNYFQIVEGKEI